MPKTLSDLTLCEAIQKGCIEDIQTLLERGSNPNQERDSRGNPSLYLGIEKRSLEIVQLLLKYGADPNIQDQHQSTALGYAITQCELQLGQGPYFQIIRLLIISGGDLLLKTDRNENRPICFVRAFTLPIIRKHLIEEKAYSLILTHILNPDFEITFPQPPTFQKLEDLSQNEKRVLLICGLLYPHISLFLQILDLNFPSKNPRAAIQMDSLSSMLPHETWIRVFAFTLQYKLEIEEELRLFIPSIFYQTKNVETIIQAMNWLLGNRPHFRPLETASLMSAARKSALAQEAEFKKRFNWNP